MKLFNSENSHFFKKMSREFNFKAFSRLILIKISMELQLIDFLRCLKMFFFSEKFFLRFKEFHGLHDDLKII